MRRHGTFSFYVPPGSLFRGGLSNEVARGDGHRYTERWVAVVQELIGRQGGSGCSPDALRSRKVLDSLGLQPFP